MPKLKGIKPGSDRVEKLKTRYTEAEDGKVSALYRLNAEILGHRDIIPMTPEMHYALCLFAERATGIPEIDDARVQLIQLPRGVGKSTLITKGRAMQRLLSRDNYAIGIANETMDLAKKFLANIKEEFESNEAIQALWPERIPEGLPDPDTTWASEEIVLKRTRPRPQAPSVKAAGAGKTVTGYHMDEWIVDDLISEDLAENAIRGHTTEMEKMERWIQRLEPLLGDRTSDPITFIGTPWFAGDTYEYVEKYWGNLDQDVDLRDVPPDFRADWRLRLPSGKSQTQRVYRRGDLAVFRKPAYNEQGESSFPEIWSTEELDEMRQRPGTAEFFAANYLLNPTEGLATDFDTGWLKDYEIEMREADSKTMGSRMRRSFYLHFRDASGERHSVHSRDLVTWISVDPAFSDDSNAARTAIPVVGSDGQRVFLLEDFAERGLGPTDMINQVGNFAYKYRPQRIYLETIASQQALVEPLERKLQNLPIPGANIEEISSHGKRKKEMRIRGLEPWFRRGLFHFHPSQRDFLNEYETFPRGQTRDLLDALAFQRDAWESVAYRERGQQNFRQDHERKVEELKKSLGPGGGY